LAHDLKPVPIKPAHYQKWRGLDSGLNLRYNGHLP
jgi:hypothetical protein